MKNRKSLFAAAIGGLLLVTTTATGDRASAAPLTSRTTRWVALGDSFSAGVGGSGSKDEGGSRKCHRDAVNTYSGQAAASLRNSQNLQLTVDLTACNGAVTADVINWEMSDFSAAQRKDTQIVTLTIGGNDIGFSHIIFDCISPTDLPSRYKLAYAAYKTFVGSNGYCPSGPSDARLVGQQPGERPGWDGLFDRLVVTYESVHAAFPNAEIYVLSYPIPFPSNPTLFRGQCLGISAAETQVLNAFTYRLGDTIWQAFNSVNTEIGMLKFVDWRVGRSNPNGICSARPQHQNGIVLPGTRNRSTSPDSFHPTDLGYQVVGDRLASAVIANGIQDPATAPGNPLPSAPAGGGRYFVKTDRQTAYLQAQPLNNAATVAEFPNGTPLNITCQTSGDQAGVAPFPDNATWDYVSIQGQVGYVSDMRTTTEGDGVRTNLANGGYFLSTQGIPPCQSVAQPPSPTPSPTPVAPPPVTPTPVAPPPVTPTPTPVTPTPVTPAPQPPTTPAAVGVSQGGNPGSPQCTDPSCAFLNVTVSNMAAPYNVQCWNDHGGWSVFASYTTNSPTSAQCFMGWANSQAYAVVNGLRSNTISWDPRRPVAPPPTSPPTPTGPVIVGTYTITTDRPVAYLQAQPLNNAATLATFPNGTTVEMICQTSGDQTGVQPYPTNATWDYVRVGGQLGYIADMRLNTPGTGPRTNLPNGGYFFPSAGIPTC